MGHSKEYASTSRRINVIRVHYANGNTNMNHAPITTKDSATEVMNVLGILLHF